MGVRDLSLALFFLMIPAICCGQAYKWVDERGVVYFTDEITKVPEKYRATVQELELGEERQEREEGKEGIQAPQKRGTEDYKDRLGRGEDYWRARVEEWRKRLQALEERLEALRTKYNELTERYNSSKSSVERTMVRNEREKIKEEMDQIRVRIAEAKEVLEKKIPEEGALFRAKPEWTKP